jgi:hypothetical protein
MTKTAGKAKSPSPKSNRILTRLFWQDRNNGSVYAGDLSLQGNSYSVSTSKVKNFPDVTPDENDLVQMEVVNGRLIVGVRDHADGKTKSGWVEIDTGVKVDDHGDHSHWAYHTDATVSSTTLDVNQGNPAARIPIWRPHLYRERQEPWIHPN